MRLYNRSRLTPAFQSPRWGRSPRRSPPRFCAALYAVSWLIQRRAAEHIRPSPLSEAVRRRYSAARCCRFAAGNRETAVPVGVADVGTRTLSKLLKKIVILTDRAVGAGLTRDVAFPMMKN